MSEHGIYTDCPVRNEQGMLLSTDRDGRRYMLSDWYDAPECEIRNREQLTDCVRTLAQLHLLWRQQNESIIQTLEEVPPRNAPSDDIDIYERHTKELKKIRTFIRGRKKKTVYERDFLSCCDAYIRQGEEMVQQWKQLTCDMDGEDGAWLCHGDYNYHNLLMLPQGIAVCGMEQIGYGRQIFDLALFLRKAMEKHGYSTSLCEKLIAEYEKKAGMSALQKKELYLYLLYPVKFWKIANHYYNTHKAWISTRDMEKQRRYMEQEEKRSIFLHRMEAQLW
jgi:CotS family spore coat protein